MNVEYEKIRMRREMMLAEAHHVRACAEAEGMTEAEGMAKSEHLLACAQGMTDSMAKVLDDLVDPPAHSGGNSKDGDVGATRL